MPHEILSFIGVRHKMEILNKITMKPNTLAIMVTVVL